MTRGTAQNEAGFTLLETLVAFTILSLALVMTYQIFTDGFRSRTRIANILICEEHAAATLGRVRIETQRLGRPESTYGTFTDGYEWAIVLTGEPVTGLGLTRTHELQTIEVTVQSPDRSASVTLNTLISYQGGVS